LIIRVKFFGLPSDIFSNIELTWVALSNNQLIIFLRLILFKMGKLAARKSFSLIIVVIDLTAILLLIEPVSIVSVAIIRINVSVGVTVCPRRLYFFSEHVLNFLIAIVFDISNLIFNFIVYFIDVKM
jgi:hypothetical protein